MQLRELVETLGKMRAETSLFVLGNFVHQPGN